MAAVFAYDSDTGNVWNASIRDCYLEDGIVAGGFPRCAVTRPKGYQSAAIDAAGQAEKTIRALKRTVPCNLADIAGGCPGQPGFCSQRRMGKTGIALDGTVNHPQYQNPNLHRVTDFP